MSRRVVIGILIFLIISVVAGAVVLIVSRLKTNSVVVVTPSPSSFPQSNLNSQQVADPTGDSDQDGLSNAAEALWSTDPNNPDTDGDGFKDGEEVGASHNPTIAGPNDRLPVGFQPGQNVTPLTGSAPNPQAFTSFFADNLDLTGGRKNLTEEYGKSVPDKDKSPATLTQFIQAQPIITSLPSVNDAAIIAEQDTPIALAQYMDTAGNIESLIDKTRVSVATNDLLNRYDTAEFATLAARTKNFEEALKKLTVPQQSREYHKLLLGYSALLSATFSQISNYEKDPVKALVGFHQLDTIDHKYYPVIIQERARLVSLSQ